VKSPETAGVKDACRVLTRHGLFVHCICSDDDRAYDKVHKDVFQQWVDRYRRNGLVDVLSWLAEQRAIPVSDFLHS
jgi:homoserine kinase